MSKTPENTYLEVQKSSSTALKTPLYLSEEQRKVWRHVLKYNPSVNAPAYLELLVLYVTSYERYLHFLAVSADEPMSIEGGRGLKTNPIFAHVDRLHKQAIGAARALGITPSSGLPQSQQYDPAKDTRRDKVKGAPTLRIA